MVRMSGIDGLPYNEQLRCLQKLAVAALAHYALPNVTAVAEEMGFGVAANVITRTRDVATVGSFGEADPILRKAAPQLRRVYPPIFFVTQGSEVLFVHGADWRAAFEAAQQQAERAAS